MIPQKNTRLGNLQAFSTVPLQPIDKIMNSIDVGINSELEEMNVFHTAEEFKDEKDQGITSSRIEGVFQAKRRQKGKLQMSEVQRWTGGGKRIEDKQTGCWYDNNISIMVWY
ncbi:hypothetical protein I79_017535 [Cricetulus griseus]|uniref:Uncharacterized protein n=1 Tax=Cricetulus griseus TaxID=10029 RepID=G3I2A5_CRIGR|nr:hypothetical protein I79_017535 [Cricetulus griseus]